MLSGDIMSLNNIVYDINVIQQHRPRKGVFFLQPHVFSNVAYMCYKIQKHSIDTSQVPMLLGLCLLCYNSNVWRTARKKVVRIGEDHLYAEEIECNGSHLAFGGFHIDSSFMF